MDINELIEAKQKEIQLNHEWITKSGFVGEVTYGQPMKINSARDLTEYMVHTRTEELLDTELELLLDIKYPDKARGDHSSLEKRAHALRNEITLLELELEE